MRILVLSSLFLTLLFTVYCRSPSDFFSESDAAAVKTLVSSSLRTDGSYGSGIADTNYAVSVAQRLGVQIPNTAAVCTYAKRFLKGGESLENIYHAVSVVEGPLNCGEKVSKEVVQILENGLTTGRVTDTFYSTLALRRLRSKSHADFEEADVQAAVGKIVGLQEDDGTFKNEQSENRGSAFYAGLAFQAIAAVEVADANEAAVKDVVENIEQLLSLAEEDGVIVFSEVNALDNLKATASVLTGINALQKSGHDVQVTKDQIIGFAEYFIKHKHPTTLKDAYFLLAGLDAVAAEGRSPLVLTIPRSSILASSKRSDATVKARVTDIFGRFASPARVYLIKAYPATNERDILLRNQEGLAEETDNTAYSFNFLATKPEPGYYYLEFSVTPKDTKFFSIDGATRSVKVVSTIEVIDAELRIADSKDEDEHFSTSNPTFPNTLKDTLTANAFQHIFFSFKLKNQASGKSVQPHQVFVRFTNANGQEAIFVAKQQSNKKYQVALELRNNLKAFNAKSGAYSLELIVGDPFIQNPISWKVATINIDFGGLEAQFSRPAKQVVQALPEIAHQFRPAESRPREIFSLIGTGAALAPLLILFVGITRIGANLKNFPGGAGSLSAFLFHILVAAIFALFGLFWVSLDLVDTLKILFFLSIPTLFFGYSTLKNTYKARVGEKTD